MPASPTDGNAAALMAGADERIERLRKADATIVVQDAQGRGVAGVALDVDQTQHAFLFGCAALSLLKHADAAQERLYQERFAELFNLATVLTYWHVGEPERGRLDLGPVIDQVARLKALGIRIKGHPLVLAQSSPPWAPSEIAATRDLTRRWIADVVGRLSPDIGMWDVVGDATTAAGAGNGLAAWAREAGAARYTEDALRWTRAADASAQLLYNDYKLDDDFTRLITDLHAAHAPLDILGLEAHMIGSDWPLEKVWETAETFARLGHPLHFTEVTVLSDDPAADHAQSWPSTADGERRQADYVERFYRLLFSHPAVQSIGWWNFVDGDWDRNPGGLLRADLTPKPAFTRVRELIRETWRTRVALTTGVDGSAAFRGFAGSYRIAVGRGAPRATQDFDLVIGSDNRVIVHV
ncbi:MAG TPA: endo-1,4-beta-xylanase [Planctomycetota bacterium]|nr:endo-1,4-beta-xylanase [Planctomycetota bacterium]